MTSARMQEIYAIQSLPEFDLKNFSILDLECKVLRKYYIELVSVLFINNISKYFLTEFIVDHREFDRMSDAFAHKDKSIVLLNIVHRKMKNGDAQIFRRTLDTMHFYGDEAVRTVVGKMKSKLFEMKVNKRNDIEQRMNNRIAGKPDTFYEQDDYPKKGIPDFSTTYRIIIRCILKIRTTMSAIFRRMDIQIVREACIKNARTPHGPWLTKQFINAISLVETSDELIEILMHTHHLDWINFSILERLVENTKSELAEKVLDNYKKYTLQLTFITVFTMNSTIPEIEEPGPEYTKVKEIFALDVNKMTVGQLLQHRTFLERNVFDINEGSTRVCKIDHFDDTIVWIIPTECSYHAYRYANSSLHKFDTILSLEIENYPIIKRSAVELSIDTPPSMEASSVELVDRYGTVLLEQLNATSFATTMHDRRMLGNEDFRVINSAATEYQKNSYILARVQNMDNFSLLRFVDILQSLDYQRHIGMPLINDLFSAENESSAPTEGRAVSSSEVTVGKKRSASHGESPRTKRRLKLLAVSRKFFAVVRKIAESMEKVKSKPLLSWLASVNVCNDPKIPLFPPEVLSFLEDSSDSGVLVNRLSFYWSWIDYGLLEDLVRISGCEKASKLLERFKSELGQVPFLSSSTVPSPCSKMVPADEQPHTILTLTVDCKLIECTLTYISTLKSTFSNFCGLTQHALLLIAVKQISVKSTIFYWLIFKQIVPVICTKVLANCSQLRSSGIMEVSVYPGLVLATDREIRVGALAFLSINDGIVSDFFKDNFNDNVKSLMSRIKDLPEVVAKVQCEVDPLRRSQGNNSGVTQDVAVKELTSFAESEDQLQPMDVTTTDQEGAPADASIDPTEPEKEEEDEDDESDESDYDEDISTIQNRSKNTHLIDMWLKPKTHYCLQLEQYVPKDCLGRIFSSNWELREAGLKELTQEILFLLMPKFACRYHGRARNWRLPRSPDVRQILECCCAILAYSCTDKVIKVYQAALRLCWMIVYNALCTSQEELDELREFFKPILSVIISRYDDRELSIRQCTKTFLLQFFHSITGALFTIKNPFGAFHISGIYFVFSSLLKVPVDREISYKWWKVRLNFISDTFSKYGDYYFPQEDVPTPEYYEGKRAPTRYKEAELPVHEEETLVILTLIWRFASIATTHSHRDLVHTAAQIYRNTIQIVYMHPRGMERAKEILLRCDKSTHEDIKETIRNFEKKFDRTIENEPPHKVKEKYNLKELPRYRRSFSEISNTNKTSNYFAGDPFWGLWGSRVLDKDKIVALTNYHTMISSIMYPPIFLSVPVDDKLVHVQGSKRDGLAYREGREWIKGRIVNDINNLRLAQDTRTGTLMTVTQASLTGIRIGKQKEKLLKEVSLSVGLHHPNIVRYIGATLEETTFSIFQEWTAGGTLQDLLSNDRLFHPSVVTSYTKQLMQGVRYLHANNIIHRNLCGATVLLDHYGQGLRIFDLSSAVKVIGDQATRQLEFSDSDDHKCYNVFFTAPEVLRRESYGMSCDAWSIGCCVILIATGRPPWAVDKLEDPNIDIVRVAKATSPPIIPSYLPGEIAELVVRCLDIKPEDRLKLLNVPEHHLFHADSFARKE